MPITGPGATRDARSIVIVPQDRSQHPADDHRQRGGRGGSPPSSRRSASGGCAAVRRWPWLYTSSVIARVIVAQRGSPAACPITVGTDDPSDRPAAAHARLRGRHRRLGTVAVGLGGGAVVVRPQLLAGHSLRCREAARHAGVGRVGRRRSPGSRSRVDPGRARRPTSLSYRTSFITSEDTVEALSIEGQANPVDGDRLEVWIRRYLDKYTPMSPDLSGDFLRQNLVYEVVPQRALAIIEREEEFASTRRAGVSTSDPTMPMNTEATARLPAAHGALAEGCCLPALT